MIGKISGTVLEVVEPMALIDVGGCGYEVELTTSGLVALGGAGEPCQIFTHLVVREDAQLLYGFGSRAERDLFRVLIKVNGLGPKLGLAILSSLSLSELASAVRLSDAGKLTKVPGVGKKTAERLLVELRGKLDDVSNVTPISAVSVSTQAYDEALLALIGLGYKQPEAEKALAAVAEDTQHDAEAMIRAALRGFGASNAS